MCPRSLVPAALVALLVAPSLAPARVIHFTCRDGVLVRRLSERRCRVGEIGPCGPLCDADQTCNGVCTFVLPICPPVVPACVPESVTVAVGEKKVVIFPRMPPDGLPRPGSTRARLVLRCRRHPPGIPCPVPTTSPTSTTTSTTSSTSTTTRPTTTSTTRAPTTTTTSTTTSPTTTTLPPGVFPRGMYETTNGAHNVLFQSLGFTAVNAGASRSSLDAVAALNLKGMVWLGDYDNDTCAFTASDATVAVEVDGVKGHPAILGYYVADEPEQALETCPNVAQQIKARSDLVKLHDPTRPTYVVVSNSAYVPGGTIEWYPYHYLVGTADILGLDIYPCHQPASAPCDFADIDRAIAAANSQGVPRYYAVIQDFEDSTWRRPTPDELRMQFDHWASSCMEGYFIFSWDWMGNSLDGNTAQQDTLRTQNARVFGSGDTTPPSVPNLGAASPMPRS